MIFGFHKTDHSENYNKSLRQWKRQAIPFYTVCQERFMDPMTGLTNRLWLAGKGTSFCNKNRRKSIHMCEIILASIQMQVSTPRRSHYGVLRERQKGKESTSSLK